MPSNPEQFFFACINNHKGGILYAETHPENPGIPFGIIELDIEIRSTAK